MAQAVRYLRLDLGKDPHEMNNLIDDPEYDKVEKNLMKRLEELRRQYNIAGFE